jgi:glutamate-5-semialdehyde dehydrogenase
VVPASEEDWATEYSDLIVSIKIVNSLDEAIKHVDMYGSGHTESIVTEDKAAATEFMSRVDAAGVYHNVSTRFADGFPLRVWRRAGNQHQQTARTRASWSRRIDDLQVQTTRRRSCRRELQ